MGANERTWFGDESGRNSEEDRFLARIRLAAAIWRYPDINAGSSSVFAGLTPLMLELEIPNLPIKTRFLRVSYWTSGAHPVGVEGCWEDDHFEGPNGRDLEELTVSGVEASPEQYADWAADWFAAQMSRPIVKQEWLRGEQVSVTIWLLPETGRILQRTGCWFGGRRTDPDRTTRIR